jgi:hypothetical protein
MGQMVLQFPSSDFRISLLPRFPLHCVLWSYLWTYSTDSKRLVTTQKKIIRSMEK